VRNDPRLLTAEVYFLLEAETLFFPHHVVGTAQANRAILPTEGGEKDRDHAVKYYMVAVMRVRDRLSGRSRKIVLHSRRFNLLPASHFPILRFSAK
jgi:hypothetical protein